jgi:hypothetical protein
MTLWVRANPKSPIFRPRRIPSRRQFGHDAVRAQFDLPDFFENLAGDHGC